MIRLVNVNKYFNRKKSNEIHVINNTTIELGDKGLVTFLGNSGCGKTTLLNAIGGLDKVNSGDIYIDGEKMTTRSENKKDEIRNINVGYIFQNFNLIEDDTVFDNVALVLKMTGVRDKQEIEERVMYILKRVGIDKYRNRPAKMLSGGERQRVGIARAIVKNPKIIIADEPTGNLDSKNTIEIMNIIKAISREKLVILVTHERDIAEFYASRIVEIVDGRIVSDRENQHSEELDYRLENKIYLQDLPVKKQLEQGNVKIQYFSDREDEELELKIVIRNHNIYIQTPGFIGEGSDAAELIDDHYKKISKDIYEEYEFDYGKIIDKNFQPRYTSVFNLGSLLAEGYRKIFNYSVIKKILLVGFILASMFSIYAVSNIAGITNIRDEKFVRVNQNYLQVSVGKVTSEMMKKYERMDGIDYVLAGDSLVSLMMPLDDYYQSAGAAEMLQGSLAAHEMVEEDKLIAGKMPEKKKELVIDKIVADNFLAGETPKMIGVDTYEELIGRTVTIDYLGNFTVAGITDQKSPSIYAARSLMADILMYQTQQGEEDTESGESSQNGAEKLVNWELAEKTAGSGEDQSIEITSGTAPEEDYHVLINEMYRYDQAIGSTIDTKVNGRKLIVCGYYKDPRQGSQLYVNANTARYSFLETQQSLMLSPKTEADQQTILEQLQSQNVKVEDCYQTARENYIDSMKKQIIATILVSGIILLISLIEIYLMLRSSFLSRIKEVGVLRAIGLKKKDIYKMFAGEIVAMTTLTTLPGMAVMAYILNAVSKAPIIGEQYMMNAAVFLISFGVVFGFNLMAGLLPVFGTMRKTPAEILARNDVN